MPTPGPDADPWRAFSLDPRDPAYAAIRADDADREVVRGLLAEAYAEGRLDRDELDERSDQVGAARTLGQLPPILADLVPERPSARLVGTGGHDLTRATPADLQQRAEEHWRSERRNAVLAFLGPTIICWAIWLATAFGAGATFPWPLIVTAATGFHLARTLVHREDTVRDEVRRLEKQQARELRPPEDRG